MVDLPRGRHREPHGLREVPVAARGLMVELRGGAFPGSGDPDVAVHIPRGFDRTLRPGLVVYFHGWQGCVAAALADVETPCSEGGDPRPGAALATQIDAARVNALLVAVELRADAPTGDPGQLTVPGAFRALLRELLDEHLAGPIGGPLEVDALDRVVVVAHSGGYQAAASLVRFGDVPVSEVDLLDALYGGEDTFSRWVADGIAAFEPRVAPRRFVDLYTCCGGTADRSRTMQEVAAAAATAAGWRAAVYGSDADEDVGAIALAHAFVFQRVPREHSALPAAYMSALLEASGFATISP
jgi:hypothetical protein